MVNKWETKYYNMKGLGDIAGKYLLQGPDIERLKEIVKCEILGPFGMDSFEVIQNIHTPKGFQKMMSTPLWKCGSLSRNGRTLLFRNLAHSIATSNRKSWFLGLALDKLLP